MQDNISIRTVDIKTLLTYYDPERIEGYCKSCPNYDKSWSCPPHTFLGSDYLRPYEMAIVIGYKIEKEASDSRRLSELFMLERKKFGNILIEIAEDSPNVEILIAGNCYLCKSCLKASGKDCIHPDKLKYSLESIGFDVGAVTESVLKIPLSWPKDGREAEYLMTVGVILCKDRYEDMTKAINKIKEYCL